MGEKRDIECRDCGETPVLREAPYDGGKYVIECGCGNRGIDVTDCVSENNLVEPVRGKWSNINIGNPSG